MEDAEGYEILTGDKISRLRQEVDRFKGNEKPNNSQDLTQAVKELNESIKKLYQLFADVQEEIVKEYTSGESPEKKMDRIIEQNKHIAEAVVVLSEKLNDEVKEQEQKEEKQPMFQEKPVFEEQSKSQPQEQKSWFPFGKQKQESEPEQSQGFQQPSSQKIEQPRQPLPQMQTPQQPIFRDEDFKFPVQQEQFQPRYPQQPQFQQPQQQWTPQQPSFQYREEDKWGDDNELPPPPAPGIRTQQDYSPQGYPPNISRSRPQPEPMVRNQQYFGYRQPQPMQRQGYVNPNFPTQENFQGLHGVSPTLDRPLNAESDLERRRGLLGVFKK